MFKFILLFFLLTSTTHANSSDAPEVDAQVIAVSDVSIVNSNSEKPIASQVAPEDGTEMPVTSSAVDLTGAPEGSTAAHNPHAQLVSDEVTDSGDNTVVTEAFDANKLATGHAEGSTKEPYMPKPKITKPPKNVVNNTENSKSEETVQPIEAETNAPEGGSIAEEVSTYAPEEGYSSVEVKDSSHWTTRRIAHLTISQKIDTSSDGYKQLLHMLEDLNARRSETMPVSQQTVYYQKALTDSVDTSDPGVVTNVVTNITKSQQYIQGLLSNASKPVLDAYGVIISTTSTPEFYYIPKTQRFLMVNKILSDLPETAYTEIMGLDTKTKTYCRGANVDIPPYMIGNLVGNKMGNGAIITK